MSEQDTDIAALKIVMRKNGDLVLPDGATDIPVAHYSRATEHLEFVTREFSVKYYAQCVSRIGSREKGTQPSGMRIRSFGVKGEAPGQLAKDAPPRPKMGRAGDLTEAVVQWFHDYDFPQFLIRYGVYTDADGKAMRKNARRLVKNIVDRRNEDDDEIPWVKDGKNTQTKAPVSEEGEWVEVKNAIVARRPTHLTFTPKEVIGGFDTGEDDIVIDQKEGGDE